MADDCGVLSESQRFQVEEARNVLGTWELARSADAPYLDREAVLVGQLRNVLAVCDGLLAALDAALKLPVEWEADAAELDRDVASARQSHYASDHAQAITDSEVARTLRGRAADLREAITRELTGEVGDGR